MYIPQSMPTVSRIKESIPTIHGALLPTLHEFAESLGKAVDAKDAETSTHSEEVADISRILAEAMGLSSRETELVHLAGHLHDIGKIGVPEAILRKAGPLRADEWEIMRRHPALGADILRPVKALAGAGGIADMVLAHHERWNGTGYPHGLRGTDIPLGARIIAVADSLSAMLQPRPYKAAKSYAAAAKEIVTQSAALYDPSVVSAFIRSCNDIRRLLNIRAECPGKTQAAHRSCRGCS